MNNIAEHQKDLDLIDLVQMFIKNKRMITSITIILTLICLGLVYFVVSNNKGNIQRNSTINILVEDDAGYDSKILLEDLNNRISSAINYEKWRNKNQDLSKFLSQKSASTLLVISKTQTINFNYSSEQNLDAKISYISYTTEIVLKQILFDFSKQIKEIKKKNIDEINEEKRRALKSINHYKNKILELNYDIEVAKFKSSFFAKYNTNIAELDGNIFLSLMNNESNLLKNKNEIALFKNKIDEVKYQLETLIKEKESKLEIEIKDQKTQLQGKIISIGQVTSNEELVLSNKDFLYLLVPLTAVLSLIFLLVFCFFREEYNKSLTK